MAFYTSVFRVGEHYESDLIGGFTIHRISGSWVTIQFDETGNFCRYSENFLIDAI